MINEQTLGPIQLITVSGRFMRQHYLTILLPGFISGMCRFIQEGGIGEVSVSNKALLGMVIFAARTVIVLSATGNGRPVAGLNTISRVFSMKSSDWRNTGLILRSHLRFNVPSVCGNLIIFIVICIFINAALGFITVHTPLIDNLKDLHVLAPAASKWPVILLLKNITIIPFTFVFEILLVLFLTRGVMSE